MSKQRRRARDGRVLHACCACNVLEPWNDDWSWYGSYKQLEDGRPVKKFCSAKCRKKLATVTVEMCERAREREYREGAA